MSYIGLHRVKRGDKYTGNIIYVLDYTSCQAMFWSLSFWWICRTLLFTISWFYFYASLAGGVIQYIYYIFSILVSPLHAVGIYDIGLYVLNFILFYYFFYCNLWLLFRAMHSAIVIPLCKGDNFVFAWKKWIFHPNLSAILYFRVRNVF